MKTYKLAYNIKGDGKNGPIDGPASIAFDAKSDKGAMNEMKRQLAVVSDNGYSISEVRLYAIRKINIDPILSEEWK